MVEHWPLTIAGLREVTIGFQLTPLLPQHRFARYSALPNYSFKPRPLRGSACAVSCTTPPGRAAVRLNSGVRQRTKKFFCVFPPLDRPRFSKIFLAAVTSKSRLR